MLLRKNMEKRCAICALASKIDKNDMLCKKYGVVSHEYHCKKYTYDPLKRIPKKSAYTEQTKFDTRDFIIVSADKNGKNAT